MLRWIFEVFQSLVIDFRSGDLSLETVSDEISEATSDSSLRIQIAKTILDNLNSIEEFNFLAIRSMSLDDREDFSLILDSLISEYLSNRMFENEIVNARMSQEHIEDMAIRRANLLARFQLEDSEARSDRENGRKSSILFCETCGEMHSSYINLDEHLAATHGEIYIERYYCGPCGGLWLTKHIH
jgi:hypothetical protein